MNYEFLAWIEILSNQMLYFSEEDCKSRNISHQLLIGATTGTTCYLMLNLFHLMF